MCKTCTHYGLYKMITSGQPFGYVGEIPCTTCSRYSSMQDNYEPSSYINRTNKEILHEKAL